MTIAKNTLEAHKTRAGDIKYHMCLAKAVRASYLLLTIPGWPFPWSLWALLSALWILEGVLGGSCLCGMWTEILPAFSKLQETGGDVTRVVAEMEWEKKGLLATCLCMPCCCPGNSTTRPDGTIKLEKQHRPRGKNGLPPAQEEPKWGSYPMCIGSMLLETSKWKAYCFFRRHFQYPSVASPLELNE